MFCPRRVRRGALLAAVRAALPAQERVPRFLVAPVLARVAQLGDGRGDAVRRRRHERQDHLLLLRRCLRHEARQRRQPPLLQLLLLKAAGGARRQLRDGLRQRGQRPAGAASAGEHGGRHIDALRRGLRAPRAGPGPWGRGGVRATFAAGRSLGLEPAKRAASEHGRWLDGRSLGTSSVVVPSGPGQRTCAPAPCHTWTGCARCRRPARTSRRLRGRGAATQMASP